MDTLVLDAVKWDLVLDASGDIAVASNPYSLAQDAASAIRTFAGECWWDTTIGLPYMTQILGKNPPLGLLKYLFAQAASTVPDVARASAFISSVTDRDVSGQVQVISTAGQTSAATFTAINPQGVG